MSPNTSVRPATSHSRKSVSVSPVNKASRGAMNSSTPMTEGSRPQVRTTTAPGTKSSRSPAIRSAQPGPETNAWKNASTTDRIIASSVSVSRCSGAYVRSDDGRDDWERPPRWGLEVRGGAAHAEDHGSRRLRARAQDPGATRRRLRQARRDRGVQRVDARAGQYQAAYA